MRIEHIALWVRELEAMKLFYEKYFGGKSNTKYVNTSKKFASYFISFGDGARLELMNRAEISSSKPENIFGLAHFAISVGDKSKVDALSSRLEKDGYTISSYPRTTGDGYYESVVLDPEGNSIEITC